MRALAMGLVLVSIGCGGSTAAFAPLEDGGTENADTTTTPENETSTDDAGSDETSTGDDTAVASDAGSAVDAATGDTASGDTSSPVDSAVGVKCGTATCGTGEVCCRSGDTAATFKCVTGKTCPDGAGTLSCDGSEDCPASAGICCSDVALASSCKPSIRAAECRASCFMPGPTACPGTARLRRCHAKADCTQPGYTKCCVFDSAGENAELCANEAMASFAKSCK